MSEGAPLLRSSSLTRCSRQRRCRFQFIQSKGALLVLFWDFILSFLEQYLSGALLQLMESFYSFQSLLFNYAFVISGFTFLWPFSGFFSDVFVSRYKLLLFCMYVSLLCPILYWSAYTAVVYEAYTTGFIIACILFGFKGILFPFFQTTLLPFNIDQLIGSSSDELSAVIHWHRSAIYSSTLVIFILNYAEIFAFQWVSLTIFCFCIVAVLVSHSLFNHHLDKTPVNTTNPIKLIVRVLCYARKHKYPENRSALTYWEEEAPSRLDLGKDKYGGPFTEEEVEDVKTVLRLIPLVICVAAVGFGFQYFSDSTNYFVSIMELNNRYFVPIVCILLYQFLFYPCLYRFIPNLLKRISFGLLLILTSSLIYTAVSLSSYFHSAVYCVNPNHHTINTSTSYYGNDSYSAPVMASIVNEWIPLGAGVLYGFSDYFIRVLSIEFILAQSPKGLRGTMLGLLAVSKGLSFIISLLLDLAFQHYLFTYSLCSFYLFSVKTILIFFIVLLFFWLARRYKYRVRSNEINVHNIAENHIDKFIDQSLEYRRQMEYLSATESSYEVN